VPETGSIAWSEEIHRIFGVGENLLSFGDLLRYVHPRDRDKLLDADRALRSGLTPVSCEHRILRPNGGIGFVRTVFDAIRDDQGKLVRTVGVAQDITDEVNHREAIRENEDRLKNAERIAHIGNWRWAVHEKRVFWSEEMLRIFGVNAGSIQRYDQLEDFVVSEDRERVRRWLSAGVAGTQSDPCEFQIARPDGALRTIVCDIELSLDEDGTPSHISGTCQDVTERRRAQQESFALQKLESVGTLASGIAHDFNNLLGAVLVQAELAISELQSGLRPEQELRHIREVAIHGADIVRQLMIYAGKENQVVEPVNLSQLVGDMLELLRLSVSKSVTLETGLDQQLPSVKVNPAQLRQILVNLVTNASEAIGARTGVIRLTTESCSLDLPAALAAGVSEGRYVRLLAADNGGGMTAETQARAFDPFFSTKSAGRGLGLGVVHGIVRSLGGAIRIESKPGEGTTFEILLPCCEVAAPLSAVRSAANGGFPRLHKSVAVLLVEDQDALRQPIAKLLRHVGFNVFEAGNGTDAIDLLRAHGTEIDAILLDMTIPGHSSADVLAEAAMIRPALKVLLTSAYTEEMVTEGLESPLVVGFIRKPFQLTTLLEQLRGILANPEAKR